MEPKACWKIVPNFMEIVQAVKKLNWNSRERLNFWRRPILCTTLYRNPMQASNFGGTFDLLFLRMFYKNFHRSCLSSSSIPWCKKVKNDQKLKSRGGGVLPTDWNGSHTSVSLSIVIQHVAQRFWLLTTAPLPVFFSLHLLFFPCQEHDE